jgi:predicted ArsR family transcriptional regulator
MSAVLPHEERRARLNRTQGKTLLALRIVTREQNWGRARDVAEAMGNSVCWARTHLRWLEEHGYVEGRLAEAGGFLEYRER